LPWSCIIGFLHSARMVSDFLKALQSISNLGSPVCHSGAPGLERRDRWSAMLLAVVGVENVQHDSILFLFDALLYAPKPAATRIMPAPEVN
jgi:hypothetical protein